MIRVYDLTSEDKYVIAEIAQYIKLNSYTIYSCEERFFA